LIIGTSALSVCLYKRTGQPTKFFHDLLFPSGMAVIQMRTKEMTGISGKITPGTL
jgi:hypothetical protein